MIFLRQREHSEDRKESISTLGSRGMSRTELSAQVFSTMFIFSSFSPETEISEERVWREFGAKRKLEAEQQSV